jgi:hypothetical protein
VNLLFPWEVDIFYKFKFEIYILAPKGTLMLDYRVGYYFHQFIFGS